MLKKITLLFRKKYDSNKNKLVRKYYELKLLGFEGIILKAGGEEAVIKRAEMFNEHKEDITADIHILTEDAIQDTISKENEDFKKGFRKFGEIYLDFLKSCNRFSVEKENPNMMEEAKKKAELDIIKKTQGKYSTQ